MQIMSKVWVKSTVMAMEISDSIIHSSTLNRYRTSMNHPVSFKIKFKIDFHIIHLIQELLINYN